MNKSPEFLRGIADSFAGKPIRESSPDYLEGYRQVEVSLTEQEIEELLGAEAYAEALRLKYGGVS